MNYEKAMHFLFLLLLLPAQAFEQLVYSNATQTNDVALEEILKTQDGFKAYLLVKLGAEVNEKVLKLAEKCSLSKEQHE